MDPNLSKLDPKLREAYERVMNGSPAPAGQNPTPPPAPNPGPAPLHPNSPVGGPTPPSPMMGNPVPPPPPPMPQTSAPDLSPTPAVNSTMAFNAHDSSINKGTSDVKKGGGFTKVLMLGIVVVAFLLIYTVVWVYLFHLKLPFIG